MEWRDELNEMGLESVPLKRKKMISRMNNRFLLFYLFFIASPDTREYY